MFGGSLLPGGVRLVQQCVLSSAESVKHVGDDERNEGNMRIYLIHNGNNRATLDAITRIAVQSILRNVEIQRRQGDVSEIGECSNNYEGKFSTRCTQLKLDIPLGKLYDE